MEKGEWLQEHESDAGIIDGTDNYQFEMESEEWNSDTESDRGRDTKFRRIVEYTNDSDWEDSVASQQMVGMGDREIDMVRERDFEEEGIGIITVAEQRERKNNREWERLIHGSIRVEEIFGEEEEEAGRTRPSRVTKNRKSSRVSKLDTDRNVCTVSPSRNSIKF